MAGIGVSAKRQAPRLPASEQAFLTASALLFAGSAALTVAWSLAPPGFDICGGGTGSIGWRPPPGGSWPGAAAAFLGMWMVMMAAMMLPSLVPMLRHYRRAAGGAGATALGRLTLLAGAGYFSMWALAGAAVFVLGAVLAVLEPWLPSPAAGLATGLVVMAAGGLQFTPWKARHLAACRAAPICSVALSADPATAWRYGLQLGRHCCCSCAGPMAVLLVVGMMDLAAMATVTAAITADRLAPAGDRVGQAVGGAIVLAGLLMITGWIE